MTFQVTIIFGLDFMSFCGGHLNFVGLFLLWQIDWSFLAAILNWNFRLQTSNFRSPHWAFALVNRYIFVCRMESHSECPVHTLTCLFVALYCITIPDVSPKSKQHCFNFLCLNRIATVIFRFQLFIPNTQYWFNTGPLSATLARN